MPTISSRRSKPLVTPLTMLATSARAMPCRARTVRSSPSRVSTTALLSSFAATPGGTGWDSLPFGPSARTRLPSICTFTPRGMGTGCLPIRDMARSLPDLGQDFAAHLLLARLAVGDDAARRRDDGDAHPAQDGGNAVVGHVHAPPRRGDPDQSRDELLVGGAVLEVDPQRALLGVLEHAVVLDEPLGFQDLRDAHLQPRGGHVHFLVLGAAGVADAGEQVGDGIASHRRLTSSP